jgi:NADH-quinone oxidoreductase subunit N
MIGLIIVIGLGILAMISEIFNFKKLLHPMVLLGLIVAGASNVYEWNHPVKIPYFDNMIVFDQPALAFSLVIIFVALLWFTLARSYFALRNHLVDHYTLVLFMLVGAIMLTAFTNMTTLFLGIEIMSIPLYVLAASKKEDSASNEAGFKYLLMGAFASSFLLFGIALVYGATASFDLQTIQNFIATNQANLPNFFYVGVVFILVAMLFKISVVPFHFWAPDVYEGAPTIVTALMSTIVKIAGIAAFLHLFILTFQDVSFLWIKIISVIVAVSLIVANVTAGVQKSVKRMLAFSSISHATFMLMAILANLEYHVSVETILYYSISYSMASLLAFGILDSVKRDNDFGFKLFDGLYVRNPFLAISMTIAMLSLAGIPIASGFFAKYFVLSSLFSSGYIYLNILAIIAAVIGACFYFKVIIAMYDGDSESREKIQVQTSHGIVFAVCAVMILVLGVFPSLIVGLF